MLSNEQALTISQKIINITKKVYMQILPRFHHRDYNSVIRFKINGDIISTPGTHVGTIIRFNACTPSTNYHNVKEENGQLIITNTHIGSLGDILTYVVDVAPELNISKVQLLDAILQEMSKGGFSEQEECVFWNDFDNLQKAKIIR